MYACLYQPPAPDQAAGPAALLAIAQEFSPRYERHRDDLVSIDVSGLERLLGPPTTIGEELQREAATRGVRVHVALAATRTAALVLAQARPGVTVVAAFKDVAAALAPIPIAILDKIAGTSFFTRVGPQRQKKGGAPRAVRNVRASLRSTTSSRGLVCAATSWSRWPTSAR